MVKVLFYANRSFHLPHLEPIASWIMKNRKDAQVYFASSNSGVSSDSQMLMKQKGFEWKQRTEIKQWSPDVTVLADVVYKKTPWSGKKVNVNHGLICKGFYYSETRFIRRDNAADLVCVPGKYHADILRKYLKVPVINTGFVKFDKYVQGEINKETARKNFGIPVDANVILFAPTFNVELSAVPILTHHIRRLTESGSYLLIKLHELSCPSWYKLYRMLAAVDKNVIFTEENDVTPSLLASNVVVSDVSSVGMEAMALNRPVILVDNPFQTKFYNYNQNDLEYKWRDFAIRVKDLDELVIAVDRSFNDPDEKKDLRRKYGPELVGELDGKASQRAAEAILALVEDRE